MFERLTADKVYLNSIRFGIQVNFPPHCGHEKAKEVDDFVKNVFDRLAAYEDTGLTPEQIKALTADKDEQAGRIMEQDTLLKESRDLFNAVRGILKDVGRLFQASQKQVAATATMAFIIIIDALNKKIDALLGGKEDES